MDSNICKLCKKETELRHSHILPEFFYSELYDELHRALAVSSESEKKIQKGMREYLLCQKCETQLSRYEGYAARLIRNIANFNKDASGRFLYSDNVDYFNFKLFQLSMLWRASISKNPSFGQVNLGPHEEKIRHMLYEEDPGNSSDYGCAMMTMLDTELLYKFLSSPIRVKPRPFGYIAYKFMTGNLIWLFFVTNHTVNKQIQEFFLQETGLLKIWLASDEKTVLLNIAKNLRDMEKERHNL